MDLAGGPGIWGDCLPLTRMQDTGSMLFRGSFWGMGIRISGINMGWDVEVMLEICGTRKWKTPRLSPYIIIVVVNVTHIFVQHFITVVHLNQLLL